MLLDKLFQVKRRRFYTFLRLVKRQTVLLIPLVFILISCVNDASNVQSPKSTKHSFSEYNETFTLTIQNGTNSRNYTVNYKYYKCEFCGLDYDNRFKIDLTGYYRSSGYTSSQAAILAANKKQAFYSSSYEAKVIGTNCIEH